LSEKTEAIKRCLQRHPDWDNCRVSKAIIERLGVRAGDVNAVREELGMEVPTSTPGPKPNTVTKRRKDHVLSRSQFAAQFDRDTRLRTAILKGIATLDDEDEILNEATFRVDRCGSPPSGGWRDVAAEPQFKQYQFIAGGQVHWAHPSTKKWALAAVQGARDI